MNYSFRVTIFLCYIHEVFKQCNDFKRNQYIGSNLQLKNSKYTRETETATSFTDQSNPFLGLHPHSQLSLYPSPYVAIKGLGWSLNSLDSYFRYFQRH